MKHGKTILSLSAVILPLGLISLAVGNSRETAPAAAAAANPALSVTTVQPQWLDMPIALTANGSIAAWQEAVIGAEIGDLRLSAVNVQVGEAVKKGQVLATFPTKACWPTLPKAAASSPRPKPIWKRRGPMPSGRAKYWKKAR
ncbi:hypothetical protein [Methylomonas koyamae]|uniref:hypothetical protein n=1 Tax=Methylomonas koyamae TaxID=702114 RepID=UPI002110817C|nr:hypothetical protein [Methylomonas koyamae]